VLFVVFAVPPKFTQVPSVVGAELHQTATLTVHAIALPAPSFTWYNGTVPVGLTNSPRIKVIVSGDVRGQGQVTTFTSTLNITDATEWDLRNYTVVASNQYGVNQTTVMLTRACK
jgi:Immunoglobulin domain